MPTRPIIYAIIATFLAIDGSTRAADYFVAPDGTNDGAGAIGSPWATFDHALDQMNPGDTLYARGGVYSISDRLRVKSDQGGTEADPVRIWAYGDESPVLDFGTMSNSLWGGSSGRGIQVDEGADWVHFRGLTIENARDNGLWSGANHGVYERLVTRWNGDSGLQLSGSAAHNLILNSDSYENYDPSNNGENADGFAIKFSDLGPGNVVRGARAWGNSDDGWDMWQSVAGAVTVEDSWAFDNGKLIPRFFDVDALEQGNLTSQNFNGDGNGYKLGQDSGAHVLNRVLAWNNRVRGIDVNGNGFGVFVNNSTVYDSGRNWNFDETAPETVNLHELTNNVSLLGSQSDTFLSGVQSVSNTWNGISVAAADFLSLDDAIARGPRQADGSLPVSDFLRLAPGSNLIDAGVNIGLPFSGLAPDLGAFESGLLGDYNSDGFVDAADYTVFRDGLNAGFLPPDYAVWQANFGSGGSAPLASVPEAGAITSVMLMLLTLAAYHRPRDLRSACRLMPCRLIALVGIVLAFASTGQGQDLKAFPQAEGYGQYARGGRGGDVYHVTKLNDDGSFGTLRHGVENAPSSGRTIVFDVGGWINLNSKLGITRDNVTIAGQTAPGGGVGVRGNQTSVGADNVIIRHVRFRPGRSAGRVDSLSISSGHDVIFDHISAAFSYDENVSANALTRGGVYNLTMQHSAVAFGLVDHSAGSLIQNVNNLSYHHNLYAHNHTRNPKARVEGDGMDWVNNVVYDYNNGFIAGDSNTSDYFWKANLDGNYYITGPGDTGRPIVKDGLAQNYGLYFGTNAFDNDGDATHDGVEYTGNGVNAAGLSGVVSGSYTWSASRYGGTDVWQDASPQAAYERVLNEFGATPWKRDEVDTRVHDNVVNRTGDLITRESDLLGISNGGFGTLASGVAPTDTDRDGMPDAWEVHHGADPLRVSHNDDFDQDGYTDLEEYLNEVAAMAATGPLEFNGIGRYAEAARWTRQWEPSRKDDVRISTGAAFVDAVGQKAGTLTVGGSPTEDGRLYVTSGWIESSDGLLVAGSGRLDQYGGEVRVLDGGVELQGGTFRLFDGELKTPSLSSTVDGSFLFSGGVLATDASTLDLVNDGGRFEVGLARVGVAQHTGDLTLQSGEFAVEIVSESLFDLLLVDGAASIGGVLDVSTPEGFVPTDGDRWAILSANSLTGSFEEISSGYWVEQIDNVLWLVAGSESTLSVPEPQAVLLILGVLSIAAMGRKSAAWVLLLALTSTLQVEAASLPVIADTQLSENGSTGLGDATDTGSGNAEAINARWSFSADPPNRNEWIALKFDLAAYADKTRLDNVTLRPTMYRSSNNNSTSLRLYALVPGITGQDWDEAQVTYGSMPGFTYDGFSTTNNLDLGGSIIDLGAFNVAGSENEGDLATIDPTSLTDLVQSMGDNDLLTLLISSNISRTGQWRIASREATSTTTGVLTGAAGDFAPRLDFDVVFGGVLGDYNDDGVVDAADYTVWRDGQVQPLPNEEVSPGVTDIADYLYWKERYGAVDTGAPTVAVPEPTSHLLLVAAGLLTARRRR